MYSRARDSCLHTVGTRASPLDKTRPAQECGRELYVLYHTQTWIVARFHWIRGSEDTGARIEGRDDAGLGHTHSLLLHRFVENRSRLVAHLIKLNKEGKVRA